MRKIQDTKSTILFWDVSFLAESLELTVYLLHSFINMHPFV